MKRTNFYLLLTSLLLVLNSYADTDTLFLTSTGWRKAQVKLQFNRNNPYKDSGANILNPATANWVLRVQVPEGTMVKLINTEAIGDSVVLDDVRDKDYQITDSKLTDNFVIQQKLRVILFNKSDRSFIRIYQLDYQPGRISTDTKTAVTITTVSNSYTIGSPVYDAYNLVYGSAYLQRVIYEHYGFDTAQKRFTSNNPFLSKDAQALYGRGKQEGLLNFSTLLSSAGGLDVTNIADGLAKFIVKRAKQELGVAFFQKFKEVITRTPDMATLFPETASLLMAIDEQIYDYQRYLQNLREAFKKDIASIHRNLPGIIDNHPDFFSKHPAAKAALLSACYVAVQLDDEAHPGDIIANYPLEYLDPGSLGTRNYQGTIQALQLVSASLRDTASGDEASYWAGIGAIRKMVNDKKVFKMYLGLLYQQAQLTYGDASFEGISLLSILNRVAQNYDATFSLYTSYRTFILRFGEKAVALNQLLKDQSKETLADSAKVEKYARYFRTTVDLMEHTMQLFNLPVIDTSALSGFGQQLRPYFGVAYTATDLIAAISRKNYSAAINSAVKMYNLVTVQPAKASTFVTTSPASLTFSDTITVTAVNSSVLVPAVFTKSADYLIRYGSFMATVATAKSSDEVAEAIEAAALPVGSSGIKRRAAFNVSLNAYPGIFIGKEVIKGVDANKPFQNWNTYGVTAPVGVAISKGYSGVAYSVFLSVIDIGALTAFRFKDNQTATVPTIQLKHIISPGVFFSLGIPKTPLSINFGTQIGPALRKVTATTNDVGDRSYIRYSAAVVVDIPLLNFYTRNR